MPPFRNPTNRLPRTFTYETTDQIFLEMLKEWNVNQYKCKTGNPIINQRLRTILEDIREKLFLIQDFYCAFCGIDLIIAREIHREHIAPQSQHPRYIFEPENLVLACYDCNDYKGRKRTVINDTGIYTSTTFEILHPYRDDYGSYLIAHYENSGLFFELIDGVTDVRAINTLSKLGLQDPFLIKERGMRIHNALIPSTLEDDKLVRKTCSIAPRKGNS